MRKNDVKTLNSSRPSQRGSLIIELSLLMVLVGLFSVSFILNADHSSAAVQTALLKVAHDVRYAQNRAMVTGVSHGFRTLSPSQYEIYQQSPGNPTVNPSTQAPMQIDLAVDFKGVAFSGVYQIEFDSLGKPQIGGGVNFLLKKDTVEKGFLVTNNTGMLVLP